MRQDRNQFTECLMTPTAYNFCSRMSWSIVSKAFGESMKIMLVIKPWSKPLRILSFKKERQKSIERFLQIDDCIEISRVEKGASLIVNNFLDYF